MILLRVRILIHFIPNLHQDPPKPVPPAAIAAIPPVGVPRRMLHQFGRGGKDQGHRDIRVLGELGGNRLPHDAVFHPFPILAQGFRAIAPHAGGLHWCLGLLDDGFVGTAGKLLGLEIVLHGRPCFPLQLKRIWCEVTHISIFTFDAVKSDVRRHDQLLWTDDGSNELNGGRF